MPRKVLIVDDEEHIRFLYSEELADEGYDVITADSGYMLRTTPTAITLFKRVINEWPTPVY